jgi:hypothetical protein
MSASASRQRAGLGEAVEAFSHRAEHVTGVEETTLRNRTLVLSGVL